MFTLRQKEIVTGLAAPLVALLAFGLGETALRTVNVAKFGTVGTLDQSAVFKHDPETGFNLPVPGASMGVIGFNQRGMRGPEIADAPPRDTLRLAFLGSSTTLDGGISEEQTWAAQTCSQIAAALPTGCKVEYLNAGLPAFGVPEVTRLFTARIAKLQPHVVIILPGDVSNDNTNMLRERGLEKSDLIKPSWFAERSLLWSKIELNLKVIAIQRAARRGAHFVDFDEMYYAEIFAQRLRSLLLEIKRLGQLPVVVTITGRIRPTQSEEDRFDAAMTLLFYNPYTSVDDLIAAQLAYNDKIRTVAAELDVPVVDDPYSIPGDANHFSDSTHFSPLGSGVQSRRVARHLLQSRVFNAAVRAIGGACASYIENVGSS